MSYKYHWSFTEIADRGTFPQKLRVVAELQLISQLLARRSLKQRNQRAPNCTQCVFQCVPIDFAATGRWCTYAEALRQTRRFRLYQYIVKQDRAFLDQEDVCRPVAVTETLRDRRRYLESKPEGLYTIQLFFVILFEPSGLTRPDLLKRSLSTKKVLRVLGDELERNRRILVGQALSFQRTVGELLGTELLAKQEAFQFFRLLCNLDPEIARSEKLKRDSHVDYYLASSPLTCSEDGIQLGSADVEVLSLKEPPAQTFPNILRELLALETNVILCSEFKRILNDKAIMTIRTAQQHFHWSQWVADVPSIVSMILNRGKRENVIADKSAVNDVEDVGQSLSRIKNAGEYLRVQLHRGSLWLAEQRQAQSRCFRCGQDLRGSRGLAVSGNV